MKIRYAVTEVTSQDLMYCADPYVEGEFKYEQRTLIDPEHSSSTLSFHGACEGIAVCTAILARAHYRAFASLGRASILDRAPSRVVGTALFLKVYEQFLWSETAHGHQRGATLQF